MNFEYGTLTYSIVSCYTRDTLQHNLCIMTLAGMTEPGDRRTMRTLELVPPFFLPLLTMYVLRFFFPPSYVVSKLSYSPRALVSK